MSFETQSTPSKEALTEVFREFSTRIESSGNEISELRQSIWTSHDLTQNEKVDLLTQLAEADLLLTRRTDYLQQAA